MAKLLEANDQRPSVIQQSEKAYFSSVGPERHALSRKLALASVLSSGFVADRNLWQWIENGRHVQAAKTLPIESALIQPTRASSIKKHLTRTSNFKIWLCGHRLLVFDAIIVTVVILVAGNTIRPLAQQWGSRGASCLVRGAGGLSLLPGP